MDKMKGIHAELKKSSVWICGESHIFMLPSGSVIAVVEAKAYALAGVVMDVIHSYSLDTIFDSECAVEVLEHDYPLGEPCQEEADSALERVLELLERDRASQEAATFRNSLGEAAPLMDFGVLESCTPTEVSKEILKTALVSALNNDDIVIKVDVSGVMLDAPDSITEVMELLKNNDLHFERS